MEGFAHILWTVLRSILLVAGGIYIAIIALMLLFQSHLVYFPTRKIEDTPAAIGLSFEDVSIITEDNVRLNGWYIPSNLSRGNVLFCHGNGGNISHRLETLRILNSLRLNVLIFDYRGYGESDGAPSEQGTYLDAQAAWNWLVDTRNVPPGEIIIHGRSLGGAIASWLAEKHPPLALILESTFTSVVELGADMYPWLPVKLLSRFHYATVDRLQGISCPLLVIHSPEDDLIPYKLGRRLYSLTREPKEFLEITGGHNEGFLVSGQRYIEGLDRFISRYLDE